MVCPHAAIRSQGLRSGAVWQARRRRSSPRTRAAAIGKALKFTIQVAPEDCTGCGSVRGRLPRASNKIRGQAQGHQHAAAARRFATPRARTGISSSAFPDMDRRKVQLDNVRSSSCCGRCSSSPARARVAARRPMCNCSRQLFGDRLLVANATGCSSIYGGNLPTTPWAMNADGRGPAWCNSLFEDNAEFGLGFRVSIDKQKRVCGGTARRSSRRRSATNW